MDHDQIRRRASTSQIGQPSNRPKTETDFTNLQPTLQMHTDQHQNLKHSNLTTFQQHHPLITCNAYCVRRSRRHCGAINSGLLSLTKHTLQFHSNLTVLPEDAILNLQLIQLCHIRRSSYKRILPHGISLRYKCNKQTDSKGTKDLRYLFAFETTRQQMTFLHALELAVFDASSSTRPSEHDSSVDSEIHNEKKSIRRLPSIFMATIDRHSSSSDSRTSTIDLPNNLPTSAYSSDHEPRSLPTHSSLPVSRHPVQLFGHEEEPLENHLQSSDIHDAALLSPNSRLKRSQSHPGDSTSSLALRISPDPDTSADPEHHTPDLTDASSSSPSSSSSSLSLSVRPTSHPVFAPIRTLSAVGARVFGTDDDDFSQQQTTVNLGLPSTALPPSAYCPASSRKHTSQKSYRISFIPFFHKSFNQFFVSDLAAFVFTLFLLLVVLGIIVVSTSQLYSRIALLDSLVSARDY